MWIIKPKQKQGCGGLWVYSFGIVKNNYWPTNLEI